MIDTLILLCVVLVSIRVSILSHRIDRLDKISRDKIEPDLEVRLIAKKIKKELER